LGAKLHGTVVGVVGDVVQGNLYRHISFSATGAARMTNAAWAFTTSKTRASRGLRLADDTPLTRLGCAVFGGTAKRHAKSAKVKNRKTSQFREAEMKRCGPPAQQAQGPEPNYSSAVLTLERRVHRFVRALRSGP
jgi:hypothetical protein